jgi:exodeoxyribonuclease-5
MWSPQQDAALKAVDAWLKTDQQVFRLFGYAGTGKTTLAKHIAEGVQGTVLFAAPTGKAANVMHQKGCVGACTLHSLIYIVTGKSQLKLKKLEQELAELLAITNNAPDFAAAAVAKAQARLPVCRKEIEVERKALAAPAFTLNENSPLLDAALLVLDEGSMIGGREGEDLLSFGIKILVLGDPAQLPPVKGAGFFTNDDRPDFLLTEVHRQAADSPIIHLATLARNQDPIPVGNYGESLVLNTKPDPAAALACDQVLAGRNKTRRAINSRVRQLRGMEGLLVPCDRLVCLRNDGDTGLLNGSLWNVQGVGGSDGHFPIITVESDDDGRLVDCPVHPEPFRGEDLPFWARLEAQEFDYGYCLTVHKSQGSQWQDVMVFDESWCFRQDRWRWLYTGITRAAEKLTIVRD